MNTPAKKVRFTLPLDRLRRGPNGHYEMGLTNKDYALQFALIVTEFTALEHAMSFTLAVLMDASDHITAGYILRSVNGTLPRSKIMRDLLQQSPLNKSRGDAYDHYISEFERISKKRNTYVHGLWQTSKEDGSVLFEPKNDHGIGALMAREEPIENLVDVVNRIRALDALIYGGPMKEIAARRQQQDGPSLPEEPTA